MNEDEANMKISDEKSRFFRSDIEFLGHIIKHSKITVDPEKIATIRDYEVIRSFLGLSGYYGKFIKNYANITKPLTIHLRGENGLIGKIRVVEYLLNKTRQLLMPLKG